MELDTFVPAHLSAYAIEQIRQFEQKLSEEAGHPIVLVAYERPGGDDGAEAALEEDPAASPGDHPLGAMAAQVDTGDADAE